MKPNYIFPNWEAPAHIRALTTTQQVKHEDLQQDMGLQHAPVWLKQVHGAEIHCIEKATTTKPVADASYTTQPGLVCAIITADCLPILLTNREGSFVADLHCGWRGLHQDLIQKTVDTVPQSSELIAWIGPGISQKNYEVDPAFYQRFCEKDAAFSAAFQQTGNSYLANLPHIAELQLQKAGVNCIHQSGLCTFDKVNNLHSFRRDGKESGRIATLIWMEAP
jgi:polyphenol oxidase